VLAFRSDPAEPRTTEVGELQIGWDARTLEPRPWTLAQADWAVELLAEAPAGPVVELCSGVGYVGIDVARRTGRAVVQVDGCEAACRWARRNAAAAGVAHLVEVRFADLCFALADHERSPLVLADPPYVPTEGVARFPDDPPGAIDGGEDGLDVIRLALAIAGHHLAPGGAVVLQVAGPPQAEAVRAMLDDNRSWGLQVDEVRAFGPDRALVLLRCRR
jgi:release factor glutamine methyltransferase